MKLSQGAVRAAIAQALVQSSDPKNPMYHASDFHPHDVAMGWIAAVMELRDKGYISNDKFTEMLRNAAHATAEFAAERKKQRN